MRYLVPALQDFGAMLKGRRVAPVELYDLARKSLHFVGYQGLSMIAVSGLDMAAWDALAKASGVPLCVLLGGSVGPVKAYNSNGLWLQAPEVVAADATELRDEGGFTALKLRLGRDRASDDLAAMHAIRAAVGNNIELMADFNQGLHLGEALQRCHMIDDEGLAWIEEPIVYDNLDGYVQLTAELKTPDPDRREFLRAPRSTRRAAEKGVRPCHARFYAHWRRDRLAKGIGHSGSGGHTDVDTSLPGGGRARDAGHGDCALVGMAGLGRSCPAETL